ncbi:MAG TPA: hypothetical protein EYG03_09690 [Planctomycetes bacterium]|nr:hypothetical protein [Fuerstiella sp.]HIK92236.1 hypothetical protein [Planctomycetota bacterium]
MRIAVPVILLATFASFVCQPLCAADDAAKAQKLIDRAIKEIGGNEALEKSRNTIMEDNGTYYGMGDGLPYKGRYVYRYGNSGSYRMEVVGIFVQVLDGDKGWTSMMGDTKDIEGEALKVVKQSWFIGYVVTLLPLQKPDQAFSLNMAKPETIEGEECDGITVDHEQMPTLTIHFGRKTGLIKKTKYVAKVAELGYQEAVEEAIFQQYTEFDGVMSVTKFTSLRDGKKFIEANFSDLKFPDTIDESEFKKPK